MERYASQPDAAMYNLARMVEADEDPKFIARRMVIFASELKVPSGRGHAAPASLVNLKKLEDRVISSRSGSIWFNYLESRPGLAQDAIRLPDVEPRDLDTSSDAIDLS
jgi:MgsA AAA+ ATPase C terminal